jgi:predicted cobalt transporter CbtA
VATRLLGRVDPSRLGSLVLTAALVGLLAGLCAATFGRIAGEPAIRDAIAIEEAGASAAPADGDDHVGDHEEEARVSRADQSGAGRFGAYVLSGAAFGALLGLVTHGLRQGRPEIQRRVYLAGAILAGGFTVGPWFKYPPNPPAVGDPDTLAKRQSLYVVMICLTIGVGLVATIVARHLRALGWDEHRRIPAVVASVVVPLGLALALLPPAPDPIEVPATLLWRFRLASLGGNLTMWLVLTLGVGWVATEAVRRRTEQRSASMPAGVS